MTNSTVLAISVADRWQDFWRGDIGDWILTRGVRIALFLIGGLLAARLINWVAQKITRRIERTSRKVTRWSARRAPSITRRSRR